MKKLLIIFLLLPVFAQAQTIDSIFYPNDSALYSTTFTFSSGDSLDHYLNNTISYWNFDTETVLISIDTSSSTLWQIGQTLKPVFSNDTIASMGIMTDTINPYPPNANDFFVLNVSYIPNFIVDFWHRYQMDSLHAGGIVEFSTDSAATWINVAYCNQITTQNFYSETDTIISGQPAFTGTGNGEQLSRIQFLNCIEFGERETTTGCLSQFEYPSHIYLRFRFVSDSAVDSLSGWMIDSIRIENPGCFFDGGYVEQVNNPNTISIYPNPAQDELTIQSTNEPINKVTITNLLGQVEASVKLSKGDEMMSVDVSGFPSGVYFVQINGSAVRKFVKE